MEIQIEYADGSFETVPAQVEDGVLWTGGRLWPGILMSKEPARCGLGSDYFATAINEGCERSGAIEPDDDEEYVGFRWKLLGSEQEDCRQMMAKWISRLGAQFEPYTTSTEYLVGDLLQVLDDSEARAYDQDRNCWITYIEDPEAEAASLKNVSSPGF